MNKIRLVLLLSVVMLLSCDGTGSGKSKNGDSVKTIPLTKSEFFTKVANYEADPFGWKYLGDKPALIDFYASWCGPCKALALVLDELAEEYEGRIYIYKIDTDVEQDLAATFGIRSIPTLLFVPVGGQPQMAQGAMAKDELKKAIEELLLDKHE